MQEHQPRTRDANRTMALKKYLGGLLAAMALLAPSIAQQGTQQQVPDAPSAVRKPDPLPPPPPQQPQAPAQPASQPGQTPGNPANSPVLTPRNMPASQQPSAREELADRIIANVNYVVVPVLVK